ncbi:MAG TPA: glycine zipper 2TM domain-containing protein [Methylophilaceae bacterium]|nr:glycine zipper 2TM domain-containing protein [Methylophilaceae bacterium]
MRKTMIIPAVLAASFSVSAVAMADEEYFDEARVISVTPQMERVNYPRQECHTEYVREATSSRSPVGAIIGGIAGGLLGSQVGKGNGRVAGAAVGAGVGAVVGDRIGGSQQTGYATRPVEHCAQVDNWETVNRGYLVTYRYNGRDYTTVTDSDPGDRIRVRVAVSPDDLREIRYDEPRSGRIIYREPIVISPVYREHYHERGHDRHDRDYW